MAQTSDKPKCIFLMSDYGHDPTETAVPWQIFKAAGFNVEFATEKGKAARCDEKMLKGWTGSLLGADKAGKSAHTALLADENFSKPLSWTATGFSIQGYDLVFLPGGHEKGVRQVIEHAVVGKELAAYLPQTLKPGGSKTLSAICHGVQVLATAVDADGKHIIRDLETTALPGAFEGVAFWGTRMFLGDYYKTYGAKSDTVETIVKGKLDNPQKQWKCSLGTAPFIHEDPKYNYFSARFPPDAQLLAEKSTERVQQLKAKTAG